MRAAIAVTALINHKCPWRDVQFIRTHVIDHLGAIKRGREPSIRGASQVHCANPCRCCVQDHEFARSFFAKLHRGRQNRRAIFALQSRLPQHHH